MAGYIKIHRKLIEWGWYSVPCVKDVFIHLLITANYSPSEYRGVMIERGQAVYGLDSLSQSLGYSIKQVRTAIGKLRQTGEITTWTNRQFSVATIVNYDEYQDDDRANEGQTKGKRKANEGQTKGTQRAVSKEEKEEKEIKKSTYTSVVDDFNRICKSLPRVKTINDTRRRRIDRARKQLGSVTFETFFRMVEASDFLTGQTKDWVASFDWILEPKNMTKIVEGNYDNKKPKRGSVFSTDGASFDITQYEGSGLFND